MKIYCKCSTKMSKGTDSHKHEYYYCSRCGYKIPFWVAAIIYHYQKGGRFDEEEAEASCIP